MQTVNRLRTMSKAQKVVLITWVVFVFAAISGVTQ